MIRIATLVVLLCGLGVVLAVLPGAAPRNAAAATPSPTPITTPMTATANLYLPEITWLGTPTPTPPGTIPPGTVPPTPAPATPIGTPTPVGGGSWWKPSPDQPIAWHWQLSQEFVYPRDVLPHVIVYDIDGELTSADTVAKLHALGSNIIVICYFDAGVYEDYRSDASSFPKSVIGNADAGWEGSYWLDIRQIDILRPIMENRIKTWCKDKGFDAIEPDETEVWSNDSGFPITKAENNAYNQMIAELGHKYGLSVGLKGNTSETGDLVDYFDWTLNEQCWEFSECDNIYNSFIKHGKAAFNIEYNVDPDCAQANAWHMNSARRDLDLVGPLNPDYYFAPCVPYDQAAWP